MSILTMVFPESGPDAHNSLLLIGAGKHLNEKNKKYKPNCSTDSEGNLARQILAPLLALISRREDK